MNNIPALVQIMTWRQAIVSTSGGLIYGHIYASLGLSELTGPGSIQAYTRPSQNDFIHACFVINWGYCIH